MVGLLDLKRNVFPGESGGDYGALYGYSNRPGGQFENVNLTDMTVDEAIAFSDPSGPYGQWVKGQIGRVATPMGAFQVVGTTLKDAKAALGLSGSEKMNQDTQDAIGQWIYKTQGPSAWSGWGKGGADMQPLNAMGSGPLAPQQPEEKQSVWGNPDTWARLALAFNSMRMNPDQGLAQVLQGGIERRRGVAAANKTAEALRRMGRGDLADLVESQGIKPSDAIAIAYTPAKDKRTSQIKNYEYWIKQGKTPAEAEALVKSGQTIQLGGEEKAWDKKMGEYYAGRYSGIQDAAASAQETLAGVAQLEALMTDPNFTSGALAEPVIAGRKIIEAMGGDPANVASMEGFRAVASEMILSKMGGSLGAGFSEGDRKFVEGQSANLSTSKEGNRLILEMNRRVANRKIELAKFADAYVAEHGRLDAGFNAALRKWAEENPLFPTAPSGRSPADYMGGN